MKICIFISGDLWGGAEAQVYQLVSRLLDISSHDIIVVTLNKNELYQKFSELPIATICLNERTMSVKELVFSFRNLLKRHKVNLVHCHGFKENFIAGLSTFLVRGVKLVRTHHGRGVVSGSRVKRLIENINAKYLTDKLICVSHELKNYLQSLGYPKNKIVTIHNGIDCQQLILTKDREMLLNQYGIDQNTFVIGTASRIEAEKGYQFLLSATNSLINKGVNVCLFLVGDGSLSETYKREAAKLGIKDAVIFAGFKQDAINYINMFDVFVMMSLNEGIPIALIEAMCLSKTVVSSAVGGIPEVIDSMKNGILVPSGDADACADAIYDVYKDEILRKSLEDEAHLKAQNSFSADTCATETLALYERVIY